MSCKLLYVFAGLLAASATVQAQIVPGLLSELMTLVMDLAESASELQQDVDDLLEDLELLTSTMQVLLDAMGRNGVLEMVMQQPELPKKLGKLVDKLDALLSSLKNRLVTLQGEQKERLEQYIETLEQQYQQTVQWKQTIDSALQAST